MSAPALRCRHRLPGPEAAGALTWEVLKEWAARSPHLRPCKRKDWWWIERKECEKCPDAVRRATA